MSLEEIDRMFEIKYESAASITYKRAVVLAKEAIAEERRQIAQTPIKAGIVVGEEPKP